MAADRPACARLLAVAPAGRSAASYTITRDTTEAAPRRTYFLQTALLARYQRAPTTQPAISSRAASYRPFFAGQGKFARKRLGPGALCPIPQAIRAWRGSRVSVSLV